jgi:HK97 family phage major capsid protein
MATITLLEASKLSLDDLVSGVIENIVTVNPIYAELPFTDIDGNALRYNREKTLGDVQVAEVGGTITAKAAASYKKVTSDLTTIIGDAEVNGLIQSQRVGGDQVAHQVASKAKQVGRTYQNLMINGDSANAGEFDGLIKLVADIQADGDNAQEIDLGGAAFTFEDLDELLMQVKAKDGQVDFIMMNSRDLRKVRQLKRALGGTDGDQVTVNGVVMESYAGVPIYRNDWIPTNLGAGTNESVIFAGCFDDGSQKMGISGLTAVENMGVHVQAVGASETKDEEIYRVKFYSGFAVFNELGIAMLKGVTA